MISDADTTVRDLFFTTQDEMRCAGGIVYNPVSVLVRSEQHHLLKVLNVAR